MCENVDIGKRMETTIKMVTYRPVKKWLLPLLVVIIGIAIGFTFFPSKQDYHYKQWVSLLESNEKESFNIESVYYWDDQIYSQSEGVWTEQMSYFDIVTPFSDGSEFSFEAYLFTSEFYTNSNNEWFYGSLPHNFTDELAPLDNPFEWASDILQHAEQIYVKKEGDLITYEAVFEHYPEIDFRGTLLKDQNHTYLKMLFKDDIPVSFTWNVSPERPESVSPFAFYPDELIFQLDFKINKHDVPALPEEAEGAEELE